MTLDNHHDSFPVDIVIADKLVAEWDDLKADVLALSVTIQPQGQVVGLSGQLLAGFRGFLLLLLQFGGVLVKYE